MKATLWSLTGMTSQDKSAIAQTTNANDLSKIFSQTHAETTKSIEPSPIKYRNYNLQYKRTQCQPKPRAETILLIKDPAIEAYFNKIRMNRGNNGYLSPQSFRQRTSHIKSFLRFVNMPINDQSITKLVEHKRNNPQSTDIERAVTALAAQPPIKNSANRASTILGLFRANFTPLNTRVNTHFSPSEENCTEGIFLDIYQHQDQETKDLLQWTQYVPERIKAACRVPFEDIDLSRKDYAIIWIQAIRSKTRTKHPCFVPIDFAKRVIQQAKAAQRTCPFPNHENIWRRLTAFAKQEYKLRLVSNYLRKRYVDIAEQTTMPKAQAAFIMGDKTKIALEGIHLDLIYGRGLRFVEELIKNYDNSGLAKALNIEQSINPMPIKQQSKKEILAEINRLQSLLTKTQ